HLLIDGTEHGLGRVQTTAGDAIIAMDDEDAAHDRYADQRDKSDRGRNAEIQPENVQSKNAAADRERKSKQRQQAVTERIEQPVEQHHDQDKGNGQNNREPLLGLLQRIDLSRPIDAIAGWQLHIAVDALLRFLDRTGKIAASDAELDRHKALVFLAKDVRGAGVERDVGEITERNMRISGRRLNADLDILHLVDVVAIC